jgi:hypothetical protein
VPVAVTSNEVGAATIPVLRVEAADGRQMTYPDGPDLASGRTVTAKTPEVIDSPGERFQQVGGYVALGAGIVAGGIVIAATAGLGTPGVVAAGTVLRGAAAWGIGSSGAALAEIHDRGVDSPTPRSRARSSTLSLGALSAGVKIARSGAQLTSASARTVAGLQVAANTADAVAAGDRGVQLAQNWDRLDNGQRAAGLLNIAFWAGMGAASTAGTGAPVRDAFSFSRLENQVRSNPVVLPRGLAALALALGRCPGRARRRSRPREGRSAARDPARRPGAAGRPGGSRPGLRVPTRSRRASATGPRSGGARLPSAVRPVAASPRPSLPSSTWAFAQTSAGRAGPGPAAGPVPLSGSPSGGSSPSIARPPCSGGP